jgi:signal transduction histidine kinase
VAVALVLTQSVPLVWRRDQPVAVLAIIGATYGLKFLLGLSPTPPGAISVLIALYSVSVYSRTRWRSLVAAGAAAVFVIAAGVIVIGGNLRSLGPLAATAILLSGAWLLGDYLRTRRAYLAELEAKAARLERDRGDDLRRAADEERARIARELHDVVAHDVSLMVVQAGAARTVQTERPEAARAALALIENTGRQTLTELSHLLGVLRRTDGSAPVRTPQPGVDQLETLLAPLREAGIEARLTTGGSPRPLPAALDLSVFRIVQEATTNVLKHSRATSVEIALRYVPDGVVVVIHDNGRGQHRPAEPAAADRPPGHGLIGMRERVALYAGEFSAGPSPRGGFTVMARFPLPPA